MPPNAEALVDTRGRQRDQGENVATRVLVKGKSLEAPSGRADNFAWRPRPSDTPDETIDPDPEPAAARPLRPGQRSAEARATAAACASTRRRCTRAARSLKSRLDAYSSAAGCRAHQELVDRVSAWRPRGSPRPPATDRAACRRRRRSSAQRFGSAGIRFHVAALIEQHHSVLIMPSCTGCTKPIANNTNSASSSNSVPAIGLIFSSTWTQCSFVTLPRGRRTSASARETRVAHPPHQLDEVRSFNGQSGHVSNLFSFIGGCGSNSKLITDTAPWRIEVPMQSDPVSPPPMTITRLPLARIGFTSPAASPLDAAGFAGAGNPSRNGRRRDRVPRSAGRAAFRRRR